MSSVLEKIVLVKLAESHKKLYPKGIRHQKHKKEKESMKAFLDAHMPKLHPNHKSAKRQVLFDISNDLDALDQECEKLMWQGHDFSRLTGFKERVSKLQDIIKQKILQSLE